MRFPPDIMKAVRSIKYPIPQRNISLFMMYYGYGCPRQSLDEVGQSLNPPITRERVRQIVSLVTRNLYEYDDVVFALKFISKWPKGGLCYLCKRGHCSSHTVRYVAKQMGMDQKECVLYAMALKSQGFVLRILSYGGQENASQLRYFLQTAKKNSRGRGRSPLEEKRRKKFIKMWNAGVDSRTIQKEMGYSTPSFVCMRASMYRDQGYNVNFRVNKSGAKRKWRTFGKAVCWCKNKFSKSSWNQIYCSDEHRIVEQNMRSAINRGLTNEVKYYQEWKSTGARPPYVYSVQ